MIGTDKKTSNGKRVPEQPCTTLETDQAVGEGHSAAVTAAEPAGPGRQPRPDAEKPPLVGARKFAPRDAKTLAVSNQGKALEGEDLKQFLGNAAELRRLVRSGSLGVWKIGDLLNRIESKIRRKEFRLLLSSLGISRSSASRYVLVRRAYNSEAELPCVGAKELYAAARAKIPANPSKQRKPATDPALTLANTVLRRLKEFVQRISDMSPDQRQALTEVNADILIHSDRLRSLVGVGGKERAGRPRRAKLQFGPGQTLLFSPKIDPARGPQAVSAPPVAAER